MAAGDILPFLRSQLPALEVFSLISVPTKPVRKTETEADIQPLFSSLAAAVENIHLFQLCTGNWKTAHVFYTLVTNCT